MPAALPGSFSGDAIPATVSHAFQASSAVNGIVSAVVVSGHSNVGVIFATILIVILPIDQCTLSACVDLELTRHPPGPSIQMRDRDDVGSFADPLLTVGFRSRL